MDDLVTLPQCSVMAATLAEAEGLHAHARSVALRLGQGATA